jgi:hypothetical protein
MLWSTLVLLSDLTYSAFVVPISIGMWTSFYAPNWTTVCDFLFGAIFFTDIWMSLHIGFLATYNTRKLLVMNGRLVARHYLLSFSFFVDLCASTAWFAQIVMVALYRSIEAFDPHTALVVMEGVRWALRRGPAGAVPPGREWWPAWPALHATRVPACMAEAGWLLGAPAAWLRRVTPSLPSGQRPWHRFPTSALPPPTSCWSLVPALRPPIPTPVPSLLLQADALHARRPPALLPGQQQRLCIAHAGGGPAAASTPCRPRLHVHCGGAAAGSTRSSHAPPLQAHFLLMPHPQMMVASCISF